MPRDTAGFVYLAHTNRDGGIFKIGASGNPPARVAQLSNELGIPDLRLLHFFPSASHYKVETALRHHFNDRLADVPRRWGREWFFLGQGDVDSIQRLLRVDFADDLPPELQPPESPASASVRLDAELVRLARMLCAGQSLKFTDYIDGLVREHITADFSAWVAEQ